MKIRFASAVAVLSLVLAGCASPPQHAVELTPASLTPQSGRVGVVMTALPKVNTFFPGADCLLCLAGAEMMNSSLSAHTKTLTHEDLPTLKDQAAELLRKSGVNVVVIGDQLDLDSLPSSSAQGLNIAKKDFSSLSQKYTVDKLMVFSIDLVGFVRNYSAYIPNGAPKATLRGTGYMVNLKTNAYEWYRTVNTTRAASGAWDEPTAFPGLTNAYFQVLEVGKDEFLNPLAASVKTAQAPESATPAVAAK